MSIPLSGKVLPALLLALFHSSCLGHPGRLDDNGGHYVTGGYHCHMSLCQEPDPVGRTGYTSVFDRPTERSQFFNPDDWSYDLDYDGDCQSTRQEVLAASSLVPVSFSNPRECTVRTGEWLDEYTGKVFTVAAQLALDHIIPLEYAHNNGGDYWSPNKKLAFANDPLNVIAIDRKEIRKKRNRGPSRYLPRKEYQCSYARQWRIVAEKYELQLANRDRNKINKLLDECER
ncbi:MAG: HNH endonuclease [Pseudohongiellaceae bacterium]|nr:HNH endonuclease [Pseudohongiellaceae bacterium]